MDDRFEGSAFCQQDLRRSPLGLRKADGEDEAIFFTGRELPHATDNAFGIIEPIQHRRIIVQKAGKMIFGPYVQCLESPGIDLPAKSAGTDDIEVLGHAGGVFKSRPECQKPAGTAISDNAGWTCKQPTISHHGK